MKHLTWIALAVCASLLMACAAEDVTFEEQATTAGSTLELTDADEVGVLAFLNDPGTTFYRLDAECGFYSNAARQTIRHRDGHDRVYPSADDDPFEDLAEFEGISGVGPAHVEKAFQCASDFGFIVAPGEEDIIYTDDRTLFDAELNAIIDRLWDEASATHDPLVWNGRSYPVRFAEVAIYTVGGVAVQYDIRFVQTIDPECGVQLHMIYTLDGQYRPLDYEELI